MRRTSESGCVVSRALLASPPTARRVRSPMRSSRWSAQGNVYLLVEDERVTADLARELSAKHKTDGVLEVVDVEGPEAEVAIWNPDGSRAELSGNGTRIAARWLASQTGASEVVVEVGGRVVRTRLGASGDIEQDLGDVVVGPAETIDG